MFVRFVHMVLLPSPLQPSKYVLETVLNVARIDSAPEKYQKHHMFGMPTQWLDFVVWHNANHSSSPVRTKIRTARCYSEIITSETNTPKNNNIINVICVKTENFNRIYGVS